MDVGEAAAAGSGRAAAPGRDGSRARRPDAWSRSARAVPTGGSAADRLGGCRHFFRLGGVSGDDREPGCFSTAVKIQVRRATVGWGGKNARHRPPHFLRRNSVAG